MNYLGLIIFLCISGFTRAQFTITELDQKQLSEQIVYKGNFIRAVSWTDSIGENMVLLTRTTSTTTKDEFDQNVRSRSLYAYHYVLYPDSVCLSWRIYDFVKECELDMILHFLDKSFSITDLDHDGKAEIWIMYKVSCQGDVSPVPMKIIMYEHNQKYAVRGTSRTRINENEYAGGDYHFDTSFQKAPEVFRAFAIQLWNTYQLENWKE